MKQPILSRLPSKLGSTARGTGHTMPTGRLVRDFCLFFDVDGTRVWNNDMSLFPATNQERPYEQLLHYPGMLLFIP